MEPEAAQTIDVVLHSDPAPWWQIVAAVGPVVLILVVELVIIASMILRSFRGRHASVQPGEAREVGWEHVRWALEASTSNDPQKAKMGQHIADVLLRLRLKNEDRNLLTVAFPRRPSSGRSEPGGSAKKST